MNFCTVCCYVTGHSASCPMDPRRFVRNHRAHTEGCGEVTFYRTDGRTVVLDNIEYDGIGSDPGRPGVVSATGEDGTIHHLPFIERWTVEFRA